MKTYNWNKESLEIAIKNNKCYTDVLRELGISYRGRNIDTLKAKIVEYNLNTDHFTFVSKTKGQQKYKEAKNYLKRGSNIKSFKLKEKLFRDGLKENKCENCGISEWNGNPLNCQLHHIDGDPTNNTLENLQILCPNCHAQTDTYSGSANKTNKIQRVCIDCGRPLSSRDSVRCVICSAKVRRVVSEDKMPTKEELFDLINKKSFVEIGKIYNVSDSTIKKWCKRYNLPSTKYELGLREEGTIPNKICPNCGKEFHPKSRTQICCNRECQVEYAKYKDILNSDGTPIIDKDTFITYASTHSKANTYSYFKITRNKYIALEYYFLNKK